MKKTLILFIAVIAILLTSCQPTPEEVIVQDKRDSIEEKVIENKNKSQQNDVQSAKKDVQNTPKPTPYEAPETFINNYEKNNVKIMVDAKIDLPATENIHSVVLEPRVLTQELADAFLDYFIGDSPMYMRTGEGRTADSLKNDILHWKEVKFKAQNKWDEVKDKDPYQDNGSQAETVAWIDGVISDLERQLQNAPEKHGYISISRKLKTPEFEGKDIPEDAKQEEIEASNAEDKKGMIENASRLELEGYVEVADSYREDKMARIYMRGRKGRGALLDYDNFSQVMGRYPKPNEVEELAKTLSIPLDEAVRLAEEAMEALGVGETHLSDYSYAVTQKDGQLAPSYTLTFDKSIQGLPIRKFRMYLAPGTQVTRDFAPPPPMDGIYVNVDESGVTRFSWTDITQQIEVLDDDVSIMRFEDIIAVFEDKIFQKMYSGDKDLEVVINTISLSLLPVKMKDRNACVTVPVWDFRGYDYDPEDTERMNKLIEGNPNHTTYLTINAIDGSIVDPMLGY